MEANSLRLGNIVKEGTVLQLLLSNAILSGGNISGSHGSTYSDLTPLELTEDWLIKFGFAKWGIDTMPRSINYQKDWVTVFPSNDFCNFKGYGFMWYKPHPQEPEESARTVIQYVHQLQNLYFALTGKELTLKQQ